jgi:hypothetical protein
MNVVPRRRLFYHDCIEIRQFIKGRTLGHRYMHAKCYRQDLYSLLLTKERQRTKLCFCLARKEHQKYRLALLKLHEKLTKEIAEIRKHINNAQSKMNPKYRFITRQYVKNALLYESD